LLYYSLRGIDWRAVARTAGNANLARLSLALAISTSTLCLRSLRWRVLLNAHGAAVRVRTAFWATAAGYFGNNFLPARAGEVVRTAMTSSRSGLETAYVFATALSERVVDAMALVLISALVGLTLPSPPGWLAVAARPFAIVALVGALVMIVLPRLEKFGN